MFDIRIHSVNFSRSLEKQEEYWVFDYKDKGNIIWIIRSKANHTKKAMLGLCDASINISTKKVLWLWENRGRHNRKTKDNPVVTLNLT